MFRANVQDGTGAGRKSRPDPRVKHCPCGGFIAKRREQQGATTCSLCAKDSIATYEGVATDEHGIRSEPVHPHQLAAPTLEHEAKP